MDKKNKSILLLQVEKCVGIMGIKYVTIIGKKESTMPILESRVKYDDTLPK